MSNPDPAWSLGTDDEFVLEDDETFGLGDLEGAELPPFDGEPAPAPANQSAPTLEGDDPFGLTASTLAPVHAPAAYTREESRTTEQPVPRITIHAACDRHEIADLVSGITADRRMARAEITVETGGIDAAVTRFASQASPNLLILDTLMQGPAMLHALDRLATVIEEGTKVVIVGAVNDISLFRELMSRGVSEYIVPPLQPIDVIRTVCGLYVNPDKPFAGRVISVIGARGGIGASTIAHNLAWSIAERQESSATLLDLDLSFGTAALDFNQDPPQSIADALMAPDRVDDVFLERVTTKQTQRLQMLTAPATLEREFELDPQSYEIVIERVRRTSPFVVLDLPHAWSSWIKHTLLAADDAIIVAGPDLASLRNTKNIIDLLKSMRPYDSPPTVVLSMVGVPKRPEIPFKDFAEALGAEPVASIPFDPQLFGMAANNGQMVGEVAPLSKTAIALDALAASLTGRKPVEAKKASFTDKIPFLKR
ncbi:AAA family ATPase [Terricaulis silvestris]|uniref:Cell division inhibitor MinD n=1 Tax=Terricaulis silvestris TaxID=2686094 RepID=A0A6I6MWL1_9CAUL|nr:AAA family ATPase [Terricaulis silvestris]QGZ96012.1 cell division inhibitor MinD [Terricaulis silvestris]